jgi:hypothetical protein
MSGMTASGNAFDQMKPDEKGTTHHHDEQVDIHPEAVSEEMDRDPEKHTSNGAGYDLSHIRTEDEESYVTVKTWAVVVVRKLSFLSQPLCTPG